MGGRWEEQRTGERVRRVDEERGRRKRMDEERGWESDEKMDR